MWSCTFPGKDVITCSGDAHVKASRLNHQQVALIQCALDASWPPSLAGFIHHNLRCWGNSIFDAKTDGVSPGAKNFQPMSHPDHAYSTARASILSVRSLEVSGQQLRVAFGSLDDRLISEGLKVERVIDVYDGTKI